MAIDGQWRYTYVNPKAEEILRPLRKTRENLLGEVLWQEFPDLLNTPVEQHYRRAMTERVTIEFEFFYPALHCWFGIRVYPAKDGLAIYFQEHHPAQAGRRRAAPAARMVSGYPRKHR